MKRVSVIQPGARLHYAVPQIFAQEGLLDYLYTDLHADHAWLKLFSRFGSHSRAPKPIRRLFGRRLPKGLIPAQVRDMPLATLFANLIGRTGHLEDRLLSKLEKAAIGEQDAVYTVIVNEDIEVMRRLRDRGIRIIHECMIGPDVGLLLAEERSLFPGVEPASDMLVIKQGRTRDSEKYALSDLVLVPSEFAERAVRELAPANACVRKVPYGLDLLSFGGYASPVPGRVLFVGSVGLRKGVPYLAEAARRLMRTHPHIEVQVIGPSEPGVTAHPAFAGPRYLGQVPRSQVVEAFRCADVFVLPTIADSFALVHLEAMAAGVPVITTPNCGATVRDGIEGFIVPIRDSQALVDRILAITEDRELRKRMSAAARARAAEFSLDRYAQRLLDAVTPVLEI